MAISVGLLAVAGLSSCSAETTDQWSRLGLPPPAANTADAMLPLWIGAWVAALIVGFAVWGLMGYVVVRYRRRGDEIPTQTRYNLPLEVLYSVAPFVIIAVLFFHTVKVQNEMLEPAGDVDIEITVIGQKWSWTFNYLDPDNPDQSVFTTGTPAEPPTLVIPVDQTIQFNLRSADVIHSFWIPAFYMKQDVVPGLDNTIFITPTVEGTFAGKCTELCGLYHSRMLFTVEVVSEQEYEAELERLADLGQVGEVQRPAEVDNFVDIEGSGDPDEVQDLDPSVEGED